MNIGLSQYHIRHCLYKYYCCAAHYLLVIKCIIVSKIVKKHVSCVICVFDNYILTRVQKLFILFLNIRAFWTDQIACTIRYTIMVFRHTFFTIYRHERHYNDDNCTIKAVSWFYQDTFYFERLSLKLKRRFMSFCRSFMMLSSWAYRFVNFLSFFKF